MISDRQIGRRYIFAGVMFTLFVGVMKGLLKKFDFDGDLADFCIMGSVDLLLLCMFRERLDAGLNSLTMLAIGIFVGAALCLVFYHGKTINIRSDGGWTGYSLHFFNVAIIIPFYEEMVVRKLLFTGIGSYTGGVLSAIIVSMMFAAAHHGIFFVALIFSLLMCYLVYKKTSTFNRMLLHGGYNFAFQVILMLISMRIV